MLIYNVTAIPQKGLLDESKNPIEDSYLIRNINNKKKIINVIPTYMDTKISLKNAYYAGFKIDHFGHFLLEGIARLYNAKNSGIKDIIWISQNGNEKFSSWQLDILKLLKLDNLNHIVISKPTHIESLDINEPGYIISNKFSMQHSNFLSVYSINKSTNRKLWLSRSKVTAGWVNESEIEKILEQNGWEIFVPEDYSIEEQLKKILSSEIVAGVEGSAFHTLILAKNPNCKIIIFSRRAQENINGNKVNDNYTLISSTKDLDQVEYYPEQIHLEGKGLNAKFLVNPAQVLNKLNIDYSHKFDYYKLVKIEHLKQKNIFKPDTINDCIDNIFKCSIYLNNNTKYQKDIIKVLELLVKLRPNGKLITRVLENLRKGKL